MTPDDPRHGTYAGYRTHLREAEIACAGCLDALREYQRDNRRSRYAADPGARERMLETNRRCYEADPEKYREKRRHWGAINPGKVRENNRRYAAKVREALEILRRLEAEGTL